jgi:hypothetical protein
LYEVLTARGYGCRLEALIVTRLPSHVTKRDIVPGLPARGLVDGLRKTRSTYELYCRTLVGRLIGDAALALHHARYQR